MSDPNILDKINTGRISEVAYQGVKPVLDQVRAMRINEMKMEYRGGELDATKMFSKVATLCTLDDIEQILKLGIQKGNQAAREIENGYENRNESSQSEH